MAITISLPTIGGNEDTWGSTINTGLTAIQNTLNGSGTGKVTVAPDLSALTINGTPVLSTPVELNTLQGFTGSVADLNYAKDLRATGVTTAEFDKLDNLTATTAELNILDGNTASTSTSVTGTDAIVYNDNGVMKQVTLNDINTFIQAQSGSAGNGTITVTGGGALNGSGSFTTNQSGDTTITLNHDTTSQGSSNNSGNTFIQDITLDSYGHITGLGTAAVSVTSSSMGYVSTGVTVPAGNYTAWNPRSNQYYWRVLASGVSQGDTNGSILNFTLSSSATLSTYSFDTGGNHRIAIFTRAY
jgi:hypothetical protein